MTNFRILSDRRCEEIGRAVVKNPKYIETVQEQSKIHNKLLEILKKSQEGKELLDEFDSLSGLISGIEGEIHYEQGFKDAITFLTAE